MNNKINKGIIFIEWYVWLNKWCKVIYIQIEFGLWYYDNDNNIMINYILIVEW
jgi:hypothetical protein